VSRWRPPAAGAVVCLGLLGAACGGGQGATLSAQVTSWARSTGYAGAIGTIDQDLRRVDGTGDSSNALKTYCDVLVTDVLMANQNLPTPDHRLTTLLSSAYSAAGDAGHDCLDAAGGSAALLRRSATERAAARRDIIKAEARYDEVTTP